LAFGVDDGVLACGDAEQTDVLGAPSYCGVGKRREEEMVLLC